MRLFRLRVEVGDDDEGNEAESTGDLYFENRNDLRTERLTTTCEIEKGFGKEGGLLRRNSFSANAIRVVHDGRNVSWAIPIDSRILAIENTRSRAEMSPL